MIRSAPYRCALRSLQTEGLSPEQECPLQGSSRSPSSWSWEASASVKLEFFKRGHCQVKPTPFLETEGLAWSCPCFEWTEWLRWAHLKWGGSKPAGPRNYFRVHWKYSNSSNYRALHSRSSEHLLVSKGLVMVVILLYAYREHGTFSNRGFSVEWSWVFIIMFSEFGVGWNFS